MKNLLHSPGLALSIVSLALLPGCGPEPAAEQPAVNIDVPETFSDGKTTWQRAAVEEADIECLAKFFVLRSELVGSPELETQPRLFRSGQHDRRFYWLHSMAERDAWKCIAFESGKFSFTEGDGNPFLNQTHSLP